VASPASGAVQLLRIQSLQPSVWVRPTSATASAHLGSPPFYLSGTGRGQKSQSTSDVVRIS